MPSTRDNLASYRRKRTAGSTPEPFAERVTRAPATGARRSFVIQQHAATRLHWDFRLEVDGVLRSWAVPKGPSTDPEDKRFAALVEDHPLDYADFEGQIPEGNYGAGYVIVWDCGDYVELTPFAEGFEEGKLLFELRGHKLHGRWTLVRMKGNRGAADGKGAGKEWLLIKERDQWAGAAMPHDDSVYSGLTLEDMPDPGRLSSRLGRRLGRIEPRPPKSGTFHVDPMLAQPGEAFDREGWVFEIKYDGYRVLIEKSDGEVTLRSRNGKDLTDSFPEIARAAARLPYAQFVIDGEAVVLDERGVPSFSLLQRRGRTASGISATPALDLPAVHYAFDLPQALERDLRDVGLLKRKVLLRAMLPSAGPIRYSDHIDQFGVNAYRSMRTLGIEGVVGKRADSPYRSGRSHDWIKVRGVRTGDFVVAGWVPNKSNARDVGALALAEFRDDRLTFCGRLGSGLSEPVRKTLLHRLQALGEGESLDADPDIRWVRPVLVCEAAYKEYTRDGRLRQPSFRRLRDDKPPRECTSAYDDPSPARVGPAPRREVVVTNPDKVFFPEKGLTKNDLVRYYERVAEWMLPYLRNRPLVLTRFPDGIHGKSFYQRDAPDFVPEWVKRTSLWTQSEDRDINYFMVDDAAALKYLANMGAIPVHVWHSRIESLERPDWCVLDLDPKEAPFSDVIQVAREIRDLLEEIDLPGYLKTSGASGLHILLPMTRRLTHDQSRSLGELLARVIVSRRPDICTVVRAVRKRSSKVYIDYMQNRHGQLIVAPFSARAEAAASVSMPIRWSELNVRLKNANHHIENALRRLKRTGDPMRDLLTEEPDLERSLAKLAALV